MNFILYLFLPLTILITQNTMPPTTSLQPCPNSPNCVCTTDPNPKKRMKPLAFSGTLESAKSAMITMIGQMKRTRLLEDKGAYLHFEFRTALGSFKDDVELLFDEEKKLIHFRSASRVGYSDFGANRRRMKKLGKKWRKENEG